MLKLINKETGQDIGEVTEQQLQFLMDNLEEESEEDFDYYINRTTLEMLERNGADADLLNKLRAAMGEREDIEIEWVEE
ncbi:MAG TPA: galactosyldiacylglycerol synthase [Blastocatellia bacterium]|nr:galactosyldiacylglycerol synthase [Blastocatellia bacterium]